MRVLMLGWELPPYNSGGLGNACYELCKSLSSSNIDIDFIVPYQGDHKIDFMNVLSASDIDYSDFVQYSDPYNSKLFEKKDITGLDFFSQYQAYEYAASKLAENIEFDIIHAHDWLTFRAAIRIKELSNLPVILHVHSIESDRAGGSRGNPLVEEIEEICLNLADKVIAVSEHTKQAIIREYGVPSENIEVVHNSINLDDIVPLEESSSYPYIQLLKSRGYRVITNFGRLTIQKGLPNLLQAAKKVIDVNPKTLVLIVGSGEQYFELVELATNLGIGANVIFTDFQRGQRLRDAIGIGDLFVMPSISEPFGLAPLESIGYGTPALISKQSGVSEVLVNALKVDFWDIDEMANQISSVMMNDPLRDNLAQMSYQELTGMSWTRASDKIHGLYQLQLGSSF